MFDVAPSELLLVAVVALVVIGPKDLPRVMRVVGQWVGRARGMARHFRSGIDEMIRQSELEEMEKRWAAENERIMREYPQHPQPDGHQVHDVHDVHDVHEMTPLPSPADARPADSHPVETRQDDHAQPAPPGDDGIAPPAAGKPAP